MKQIKVSQEIQFLVQFSAFSAIDFFQKGHYQIKARLYQKQRTATGLRRLDAKVVKIIQGSHNHGKASSEEIIKCTIDHLICDWRCRANATTSETVFYSQSFFVENQDQKCDLLTGLVFELPSITKLYLSENKHENIGYLDIELLFDALKP
jgi:hypothetical protein